ncbi:MAG TPA: hypothetical protein VFC23_09680 [Thermoanaerobaculia bacterium]|nr:hypothetical protein [Thermoanaerobaculia bacterium]
MISKTSRRAVAALLLSSVLALTCAAPSHAFGAFGRPAADDPARPAPAGGLLRFLLRIFAFANGTMDPNGQH